MWRAARRLDRGLAGRVLVRTDFRVPRHATADLSGRTVLGTATHGKHLFTRFDGGLTLHSHLRMDGEWTVLGPGKTAAPAAGRRRPGRAADSRRAPRAGAAGAGGRADPHRRRGAGDRRTSDPTRCATTGTRPRRRAGWRPARPAAGSSAAGPADAGRARQPLGQRAAVRARAQPVDVRPVTSTSAPWCVSRRMLRQSITRARQRPGHHRQPARGRGALGLRPGRAALPAVRHPRAVRARASRRPRAARDLVVPALPDRARAELPVTAALSRNHVGHGRRWTTSAARLPALESVQPIRR